MIMRVPHALLLAILIPALCSAQEESGWKALDLASAELPGATLYYERQLGEHVEAFRRLYEQFRADQAEQKSIIQGLLDTGDEILAEVNRIVGWAPNEKEQADQRKILNSLVAKSPQILDAKKELRFYLVTQATTKDHLRKGGSLPNYTYDKVTDSAAYSPQLLDEGPAGGIEFALPVKEPQSCEKDVQAIFSMLVDMTPGCGMLLHEVVEIAILARLRPVDPYFRWFSDGFANAIAFRLLEKHLGTEAAQQFAAGYDVARYADLETHINLYYWMGLGCCIETPLETEKRLNFARYAYATLEADRLIERHGLDCVRRILDKADKGKANSSRNLFPAVKEVTGEDLEKRFRRYQTFETKEDGLKRYAEQHNAALDRKDYTEALPALLRMLELRGLEDPRFYSNSALFLYRMGHEAMGDRAILDHADFCKRRGHTAVHIIMHKLFLDYALKCRNLEKAVPSAREVMKTEPEYVPAMVVEMLRVGTEGDTAGARVIGRRILELEKNPKSPWRQLVQKALQTRRNE
ncbi:MAG: hypothetical protein ACYTE3_11740 [Planctomycetota bacterium]|jgi:hypothetical protein